MVILSEEEIKSVDTDNIDTLALRIFLKTIEIIGGPRKLILYKNLTWLPSLLEASYVVILSNEYYKTDKEIAEFIGVTAQTVQKILRADPEETLKKLEGELKEEKQIKTHIAGGLAKLAYKEIKEGRDNISILSDILIQGADIFGLVWPIEVLKRIKGLDFPVEKKELVEKLKGLKIDGINIEELLNKVTFPIKSPAELLKKLRTAKENV